MEDAANSVHDEKLSACYVVFRAERREFTFNTLMWRLIDLAEGPDKAEILDLTGCGMDDLNARVMTCPSDPDVTFTNDASRMLRVIKFVVKYDFELDAETKAAVIRNKEKLHNVPPNHLGNMMRDFVLHEETAAVALRLMKRLGLLDVFKKIVDSFPPLQSMLSKFADNQNMAFLFTLMDFGLPAGRRLSFLDPEQRGRVREILAGMSGTEADTWVDNLRQPKLDNHQLAKDFAARFPKGQVKVKMGEARVAARQAMLDNPELGFDPAGLTATVRAAVL